MYRTKTIELFSECRINYRRESRGHVSPLLHCGQHVKKKNIYASRAP